MQPPTGRKTEGMETPAGPRRPSHWSLLGYGLLTFAIGIACAVLLPLVLTSAVLIAVWVGIVLLGLTLGVTRSLARLGRRSAAAILGVRLPDPYRPATGGNPFVRLRARLVDPVTYRDVLWMPVAILLAPVGLAAALFYILFPVGVLLSPVLLRVVASLNAGILQPADLVEREAMHQRIDELARTRADSVDSSTAELRRIERDLHDGAQAQLVALSMNLGLAEQLLATDPDTSRELIAESRAGAGVALTELRSLVRGIHPPVLADRGLVGAVHALSLTHPGTVAVDIELDGHPPAPVESALYFAVAEALTNSAKHAAAQNVWIWGRHQAGHLHLQVGDDGVGGAIVTPEGGLGGTVTRLAAFDGTVTVASPMGGGTIVALEVPCALSSQRT